MTVETKPRRRTKKAPPAPPRPQPHPLPEVDPHRPVYGNGWIVFHEWAPRRPDQDQPGLLDRLDNFAPEPHCLNTASMSYFCLRHVEPRIELDGEEERHYGRQDEWAWIEHYALWLNPDGDDYSYRARKFVLHPGHARILSELFMTHVVGAST